MQKIDSIINSDPYLCSLSAGDKEYLINLYWNKTGDDMKQMDIPDFAQYFIINYYPFFVKYIKLSEKAKLFMMLK